MMNSKKVFGIYALFVLALALAAAALVQVAAAQGSAPTLTWTASAPGADIPEQVAPGYTVFNVAGDDTGYTLNLFRLKEGASLDAFKEANAAIDQAFGGEGDPVAAINAGFELAEVVGEASANAGVSGSFGAVLDEGTYVLDGHPDSEGAPEHAYQTLTVSGQKQAEAPPADQTVQMVDFAFSLPPDIRAGEQMWQVGNSGQQLHHMVLFKLQAGKTIDDFQTWMQTEGEGEPAAEEAGGVGILSPGRTAYVPMNLEPGAYVAMCFMPDHRGDMTGQPHFMLGMMQSFTVAGE